MTDATQTLFEFLRRWLSQRPPEPSLFAECECGCRGIEAIHDAQFGMPGR